MVNDNFSQRYTSLLDQISLKVAQTQVLCPRLQNEIVCKKKQVRTSAHSDVTKSPDTALWSLRFWCPSIHGKKFWIYYDF